jgi:hypothetical protein
MKRELPVSSPSSPHFTLNVLAKRHNNSLFIKGWIGDKPHLVTTDTRVSVTITRSDRTA